MIPLEPPFDVAEEFEVERARLLELLRGLSPEAWGRPTRCPGWSVLDVVVHLVGDDIGSLSWHRDGHRGTAPPPGTDATGFIDWLDELQDGWVQAGRRISPTLAIDLLDWLGGRLVDLIRTDDPALVDAHVSWASDALVPRWLDHGRDLTEHWLHRQQILDALGRPADDDPTVVGHMLDVLRWALPEGLRRIAAPAGSAVVVEVHDLGPTRWTLAPGDAGWEFSDADVALILATWTGTADQTWRHLTNNLEPDRHGQPVVAGDERATAALLRTRAIIGHPEAGSSPVPSIGRDSTAGDGLGTTSGAWPSSGADEAEPTSATGRAADGDGSGTTSGGWAAAPIDSIVGAGADPFPARTLLGDDGSPLAAGAPPIVALGVLCGPSARSDDDPSTQSCWVAEFARLADGRRVVLHEERGFTTSRRTVVQGEHGRAAVPTAGDDLTVDDVERTVLAVVLPDDDDSPDQHPWEWLAELAVRRGLPVRADDLRSLPYEIVLTDELRARLLAPPPA